MTDPTDTMGTEYELTICVDCLMLVANGEGNHEWSEDDLRSHLAAMERNWPGDTWWIALGDESDEFSWAPCDSCGSKLGGSRHSATAFRRTP